jgi:DNA-binding FrmR family transcriptional regulator
MTYGYAENKPKLRNRLSRVEGQVRGVSKMVEDDKYCIDILTQIAAIQSALDKVSLELVRDHAKHCMSNKEIHAHQADNKADELVDVLARLLR